MTDGLTTKGGGEGEVCALITNHLCWECFLVLSVYCETLHRDEEKEILSHGMWLLSNLEKKKKCI